MENKKRRIVITLDDNAFGSILPEQMIAVKIIVKAIVDLTEEGCEIIVTHGNGPQVGMINNAMAVLSREDTNQSSTPPSVCVAMSQVCIGYDPQNALREELYNREIHSIPVATMITQVRMDAEDSTFDVLSKLIGHFTTEEQAKIASEKYGYIVKEDAGRGYRHVVVSLKPAEVVEIGAIHFLAGSSQLAIACGGGGIPATRQGNHLKGVSAVTDKNSASKSLAEELNTDFLIILIAAERVTTNFGRLEEKWLDNLIPDQTHAYMEEGYLTPDFMLSKVQAAVKFTEFKDGRTTLITSLGKAKEGI